MLAVLQLLKKYNFKSTEELFRKEANVQDVSIEDSQQTDSGVTNIFSVYKNEGYLALYEKTYSELKKFVEGALDIYKNYNNHPEEAKQLMEKFRGNLEEYYQDDLRYLSNIIK